MIVVMKSEATMSEISGVVKTLESMGYKPHPTRGAERTIIGVVDARQGADFSILEWARIRSTSVATCWASFGGSSNPIRPPPPRSSAATAKKAAFWRASGARSDFPRSPA